MYSSALKEIAEHIDVLDNCYKIKKIFDDTENLLMIQVLTSNHRIYKCIFYDEQNRLSNVSIYNTETGKEIRNYTYRGDGKTLSSMREYTEDNKLACVTFFKEDGKNPSSIIEYDSMGRETQFSIYSDNGEVITQYI